MNIVGFENWRAQVVAHYGSLEAFGDAQTIRIQLSGLRRDLAEHERIAGEIKDQAAREDFDAFFETEVSGARKAIVELEAWLKAKGLTE